jgi:hypothetical protein
MITINDVKTGYVVMTTSSSLLSRSIDRFIKIIGKKNNINSTWIPSHMGTIFIEGDEVRIGESVWPRYKIDDFNNNYKSDFIILKPKDDFTTEEQEKIKQYILDLSIEGNYRWWAYFAYMFWAVTGKKWMFTKHITDWNTVCYESTTMIQLKFRISYFPTNYDPMSALCFDILNNPNYEIIIDKR